MKRPFALGLVALTASAVGCSESPADPLEGPEPTAALSHAGRPFLPDEQQSTVDLSRGFTYAIFPEGEGQILTQTFTRSANAWMAFLELPVGCESGVSLRVRIREGVGGPLLGETGHPGLPTVVDGSFQLLQIAPLSRSEHGIRIRRGVTYAIELSAIKGGGGSTCGIAPGPAGDSYAAGQGFFEDVPTNGPGWIPLPSGEDLPFITYMN